MLNQGCRPDELRTLEQYNVRLSDGDRGTLTVAKGKSDAARRTLDLTTPSRLVLEARLEQEKGSRWVFPTRRRAKSGHMSVHQRLWGEVVKRAGLDWESIQRKLHNPNWETKVKRTKDSEQDLVLYDFRHTFASRAANDKEHPMPLPKLMAIMGQSSLRSVMCYVHTGRTDIKEGMESVEKRVTSTSRTERRRQERDEALIQ
jgi:integrase